MSIVEASGPKILAVETSGRIGSVGLAVGASLIEAVSFSGVQRHAVELMPTLDRLCTTHGWAPEDLEQVYVSAGPGSFTGLRIAITLARTLAAALDVKIVRVETVDVLARNGLDAEVPPEHLAIVLDAKRNQIYTAEFALVDGAFRKVRGAQLADPVEFLRTCGQPVAVLGEGIAYHRDAIKQSGARVLDESLWPAGAENVHAVGYEMACKEAFTPAEELIPIYIRPPEAEEKWALKHGQKQ
jgi:tRNA threonylcarbamoyl adenosine modification protein YeaZ